MDGMKRNATLLTLACILLASCRSTRPDAISQHATPPPDSVSTVISAPTRLPTSAHANTPGPGTFFKPTSTSTFTPTGEPEATVTNTPRPTPKANSAPPILNVRYSDEEASNPNLLALDIYPTDVENSPVMIYIHGGGWWRGTKANVDEKPAAFNYNGFVFVAVNYRLIHEVDIAQEMRDVTTAIAWVKENIADYGGDPNRLFLLGHSAGAHMVSLIATDETWLAEQGLTLTDIKGVISLDTQAYDLYLLLTNMPASNGAVYRVAFGEDPQNWVRYSPMNYVGADKGIPPFILAYTSEQATRHALTDRFADALKAADIPAITIAATDKTHGQLNAEIGMENDYVTRIVFEWLDEILNEIVFQSTPEQ